LNPLFFGRAVDSVFLQDGTKIRMRLAVGGELVDEGLYARAVLLEKADDLRGLRFDAGDVVAREAGLPVEENGERAADDDEREQQYENLALQRADLTGDFFVRWGVGFVHGGGNLF